MCFWLLKGVSSVPRAMDIQSEYSPAERDQKSDDPQRAQKCRFTAVEDA